MKNAFTYIVALHLLAHAVLGCCLHHTHAAHCEVTTGSDPTIVISYGSHSHNHSHGHDHHHHSSTEDHRRPDKPAPIHLCDGNNCDWLAKDSTELAASLGCLGLVSEVDQLAMTADQLVGDSLRGHPPDFSVASSPPVRTYLLYQILVI